MLSIQPGPNVLVKPLQTTSNNFRGSDPGIQWFNGLSDLPDETLHAVAIYYRLATTAFFTEILDRRSPRNNPRLDRYYSLLRENAEHINKSGFTKLHLSSMECVYEQLSNSGGRYDERLARQYLWLVSHILGWSYALLILVSLGKSKIQKLDDDQRVKILRYLSNYRLLLSCRKLEDKAIQCNLHTICIFTFSISLKRLSYTKLEGY